MTIIVVSQLKIITKNIDCSDNDGNVFENLKKDDK